MYNLSKVLKGLTERNIDTIYIYTHMYMSNLSKVVKVDGKETLHYLRKQNKIKNTSIP